MDQPAPNVLIVDDEPQVRHIVATYLERDGFLVRTAEDGDDVPVIVLSAKGSEHERVAGLELGADDYLAKPASPREIAARVRAVLRRSKPVGPASISFGRFQIDRSARVLTKDGTPLTLRPKEFDLLVHLAGRPGEVMTRSDLLRDVWGSHPDWQDPGTVTVHVRRLRRLIEEDAAHPDHIVTVYGVGYRFEP